MKWSAPELEIVADNYPKGGSAGVNAALGSAGFQQRTPHAICSCALRMGVARIESHERSGLSHVKRPTSEAVKRLRPDELRGVLRGLEVAMDETRADLRGLMGRHQIALDELHSRARRQ